jgi:hypothetical protein
MSFALEFRKKHYTGPAAAKAAATRSAKARPARRNLASVRSETRASKIAGLTALLMAAAILAVFNSDGLRLYAGDLAEDEVGRPLLSVSEAWDGAMERVGAKRLGMGVRGLVAELREASWTDVAAAFGAAPIDAARLDAGEGDAPPFRLKGEGLAGEPPLAEHPGDHTGAIPRSGRHRLDDGAESARAKFDRSSADGR